MKANLIQMPTDGKKKVKPKKDTTPSVWNPEWKYKPGGTAMDLAEKFKRIRKQMVEQEQTKKMRRVK